MVTRGKELTIEDINYIAGFFDGEGNINIYKTDTENIRKVQQLRNPKYELSVSMFNTDKGVIEWIHSIFGGSFMTRNRINTKSYNKKWKESYTIRLTANQAKSFLEIMYPYLRVKKTQAEIAIKFQEVKLNKKSRFARVTDEQVCFFENSYQQLRQTIDSCRNRFNGSVADKRFHPQRLTETTLEIVN